VRDVLRAAESGDAPALRRLLERDANLHRVQYWYTQPLHLAVREGHFETVQVLLRAGADPAAVKPNGEDLVTSARDRGHDEVAALLEHARVQLGRPVAGDATSEHPVHVAAAAGDVERLTALLDGEPQLVDLRDRSGATPLHRAVVAAARAAAALLLERGADVDALHAAGPGSEEGYPPVDFAPIDLALWHRDRDLETARLLLEHGASRDLAVTAALGELEGVRTMLEADPGRIAEVRPWGKRALSAAVEIGHRPLVELLLERGADPNWPEGAEAPRGRALHAAACAGNRALVELLLAHGADPNAVIDSAGSATYAARTVELRALLVAHGGRLDVYDLIWLGEDDEAVRRVRESPRAADAGCGGALAAACTLGRRELLVRLLEAGARVPPVLTECRSYLLCDPELLRLLLRSGMDPDLPNWMRATPLHDLCDRDGRGRARPRPTECAAVLLDAGATISARDEEYRSTPLAWAARNGLLSMVDLLLARGAPVQLADDEAWATPLAWATRRGHDRIAELLRAAGATV
jgi:ankyrin repeat protein